MKRIIIILVFLISGILLGSFVFFTPLDKNQYPAGFTNGKDETEKIKWLTFHEAVELSKKEKKKIFIDVYTDWCGWCKVMDKNTFAHPVIAKYMNEHFYAVKLNAEMKDTVVFNGTTFVNPNPKQLRSTHQLAASLLNNKLSYPTVVFLDENFSMLSPVPGYQKPEHMEIFLKYFGSDDYKATKWEDYQKTFKAEVVPPPAAPPVTSSPH